jgi:Holliday junction resolvasome RuvABC endonuclease subunit
MLLRVVGFDPSLRNWGVACGTLDTDTMTLAVKTVSVIQPVLPTGKQVRQNSLDLESAFQLCKSAIELAKQAQVIFAEVPVGSQSARAMASYGICVGVLGSLRACGVPFFEVTPTEVKMATVGRKTATKQEMIQWATSQHPAASWPYYKEKGVQKISEAKAEHMADALGAIQAGIHSNQFQLMLPLLKA